MPPPQVADVPDPLYDSLRISENDPLAPLLVYESDGTSSQEKHPLVDDEATVAEQQPAKRRKIGDAITRIPCKARGMSDSHSIESAYFDIPNDCKHGQLLICSNAECAGSGRRFRYCAICELPVAKRNFMKRHAHGLVSSPKELTDELREPLTACVFIQPTDDQQQESVVVTTNGIVPQHHEETPALIVSEDASIITATPAYRRAVSFESTKNETIEVSNNEPTTAQLSQYEFEWLELLHRRPAVEDQSSMTNWMERILEHSEEHQASLTPEQNSLLAPPDYILMSSSELQIQPISTTVMPEPTSVVMHNSPELGPTPAPSARLVTPPCEKQVITVSLPTLEGGILTDIDFSKIFD